MFEYISTHFEWQITWKEDSLWYLTRPMREGEQPDTVSHVVREGHDDRCCSGVEDIWHAVLRFTAADRFFFPEKMLCDAETAFYKGLKVIDVVHPEVSEQTGQIRRFMERFYFA